MYNVKEDDVFRKRDKLRAAFRGGMGASFAPDTLWNAVNAVTQIETSTRNQTASRAKQQFARANFGLGLEYSKRAMNIATQIVNA